MKYKFSFILLLGGLFFSCTNINGAGKKTQVSGNKSSLSRLAKPVKFEFTKVNHRFESEYKKGDQVFLQRLNKENTTRIKQPVEYVNPYIGNISHLLVPTFPTIHLPNSMLRVIPSRNDYTTDRLFGLPVVTTSHRGSSAFNISPVSGKKHKLQPVYHYSYDQEKVTPYSWDVYLDDGGNKCGVCSFKTSKGFIHSNLKTTTMFW